MTADAPVRIDLMRVGVVDVGSNTVRLLVVDRRRGRLDIVDEDRSYVRLGAEVQTLGWISDAKLGETVGVVSAFTQRARDLGADDLEVVLTAPGRQAGNGDELAGALVRATGAPVRVLTPEEEGSLAWSGAVTGTKAKGSIAVCDLGGGSCELVVGTLEAGPVWVRSAPVGALRLTEAFLHGDPPPSEAIDEARRHVAKALESFVPPMPKTAYAAGGTARALRRVVGCRQLGSDELETAIRKLAKRPARKIESDFGVGRERAETLLGGALVLAEVERRLGVPFEVSRAGMREGVALSLFAAAAEAA